MKQFQIIVSCVVGLILVTVTANVASSSSAGNRPGTETQFTAAKVVPSPIERIDSTYQWSLAMPSPDFERRAYLWVPPDCTHVRGVVVGLQNMLEKLMFQNGDFRDACAAADVAIIYIAPGSVTTKKDEEPALALGFKDPKAAIAQLNQLLGDFAAISGYSEIADAPIIPVGHSAATPFVYGMVYYNAPRCIACIPYKGWFYGTVGTVPYLHVASEWAEVGGPKWGTTWLKNDRPGILKLRASNTNPMIGSYAELGNGHFAWQPNSGRILGMFIKKAVAARVPLDSTGSQPPSLKPISIESGVLADPATLGTPHFKAYPYNDYPGEKTAAFWYIDAEMAQTASDYMAPRLAKKPEVVDVLIKGKPAPLEKMGMAEFAPTLLPDGVTWAVQPCYLETAPPQLGFGDQPLGHSNGPMYFKVTSGAIKQVGPNTFRVWLGRGGIDRQGNPWDPWAIAVQAGDDTYRSADRPVHFGIPIRRKEGKPQTITFPKLSDASSDTKQFQLHATADSGLPVQYYMVSGPAEVAEDGTVTLLPIPPKTKYPVKVTIGAFQWGRGLDPKFASAEPVVQEFEIQSPSHH